jgi:hypothetical protein
MQQHRLCTPERQRGFVLTCIPHAAQFVGRVAQLGFAAALIGEFLTGKGPLAQLGLETGECGDGPCLCRRATSSSASASLLHIQCSVQQAVSGILHIAYDPVDSSKD